MPLLPIVRLGHPALRSLAHTLSADHLRDAAMQQLIDDMVETMRDAHGVGLAATQVGASLQLFVYGVEAADREPQIPLHVVVNPMLTPLGGELVYDWEGCLSIPDLRGLVPRHPAVRVRGLDREGEPLDYVVEGFEARIVQHEFDHLNGVVFLDRMRDLRSLTYRDEWEMFMSGPPEPGALDASGAAVAGGPGGDGAHPAAAEGGAGDSAAAGEPAAGDPAAAVTSSER